MNGWAFPLKMKEAAIFFSKPRYLSLYELSSSQIHLFNALSKDPAQECLVMDKIIREKGGIDLMIVGVGMNGHIGFNEPGTSFDNYSHVIDLDSTTTSVGQKYFAQPVPLKQGITLGLKHLLESKKVIVLANGIKKAAIIKKVLEDKISNQIPASIIRLHPLGILMIDEEAASLLKKESS